MSHVRDATDDMLWLERLLRRDEAGRAIFEVLAVQRLPAMREGVDMLLLASCRVGDVLRENGDNLTIAIVEQQEAAVLTRVRHAWRVDVDARRFDPIPVAGVQCLNEGWDG